MFAIWVVGFVILQRMKDKNSEWLDLDEIVLEHKSRIEVQ